MTIETPQPDARPPLPLSFLRGTLGLLSRAAPATASRIATELFLRPRRHQRPERERQALASAEPFEVPVGVSEVVRAWRWGSAARTVLLVHGWEGRGAQLAAMIPALSAAGFSIVTFDAPAHGASPGSRSSLPQFTWSLRCVAAMVSPEAIIAHSFGCAATTLALRDGLPLARAVFIAPPLEPSDYIQRFAGIVGINAAVARQVSLRIERRFLRKWSDYSLARTAPTMTTPLLVVHDRSDQETFWHEGKALADTWSGATLLTTTGLGHRRILRDPGVIEAVTQFVAGEAVEAGPRAEG